MDLNMIKGLGRTYQQLLVKNNISNVEQLLRLLPSKISFFEVADITKIKDKELVTIEGQIVSNIVDFDENMLKFKFKSSNTVIECTIEKAHLLKKYLLTGKVLKILGSYDRSTCFFHICRIFEEDCYSYETNYSISEINSSLIEKFIEKGLIITDNFDNEMPTYIKEKLNFQSFKDILLRIHSPKSETDFVDAVKIYTYEILFALFSKYYYYILSTSLQRDELEYDLSRIREVIEDFNDEITPEKRQQFNFILKECKKNIYSNIIMENISENDKILTALVTAVAKISTKKQVVIVSKENFDLYASLKNILNKYNIKTEVMTKKGKNKENFENFNSGKFDLLITQPVNFSTLNTKNVRLIIIDEDLFKINSRFCLNCNNTDTIFLTKTKFGKNIEKDLFKNFTMISEDESDFVDSFYENFFYRDNYEIVKQFITNQDMLNLIRECANDAFDFIKNKKFTLSKENSIYLKKIIEN